MTKEEIIEELRTKLTGTPQENDAFLRKQAEIFASEGNSDGFDAAGELIIENMPNEQREEIIRITHVDGVRLDEMFSEINKLISEKKIIEAKPLAERLYKKITVEFKETEKTKYVSLRNPFEDNLCRTLFKYEKTLSRTPFDFASYITTYAYILTETGSPLDAIPVLKTAIGYNPVDCGPKFELAEVYKLLKNKRRLIETTIDTLRVASSPVAIARCYANVGYILTDFHEYEDAAAFYTASVMFAPNPAIPYEMQHLADLKGTPIVRPTRDQIVEIMKKYEIEFGPSETVVSVAAQLSAFYLGKKDIPNALRSMKLMYNLTRDEKVKELILKYEPPAQKAQN